MCLCVCLSVPYICISIHPYIHTHTHTHIPREREPAMCLPSTVLSSLWAVLSQGGPGCWNLLFHQGLWMRDCEQCREISSKCQPLPHKHIIKLLLQLSLPLGRLFYTRLWVLPFAPIAPVFPFSLHVLCCIVTCLFDSFLLRCELYEDQVCLAFACICSLPHRAWPIHSRCSKKVNEWWIKEWDIWMSGFLCSFIWGSIFPCLKPSVVELLEILFMLCHHILWAHPFLQEGSTSWGGEAEVGLCFWQFSWWKQLICYIKFKNHISWNIAHSHKNLYMNINSSIIHSSQKWKQPSVSPLMINKI